MNGNDSRHTAVWDWDGYADTPEYKFWCVYANSCGRRALLPMCALGSAGVYMARKGFIVTAFDLTDEMIEEGGRRFGDVDGLELEAADICDFIFPCKTYDFAFVKDKEPHSLRTIDDVRRALGCVCRHLRAGGCFAMELTLPPKVCSHTPRQVYDPRKPNYVNKRVWKESECRSDAAEKRNSIDQLVFVESDGQAECFEYSICLQYFDRDVPLKGLEECGFAFKGEYSDRQRTTRASGAWRPSSDRKRACPE